MEELLVKENCIQLLLDWIRPLKEYYSPKKSMLKIGHTSAHYGEKSAQMEGFTRVLWGVGPLLSVNSAELTEEQKAECEEWKAIYLEGLLHGTDPECEEYWGDMYDYDQKMVEVAAIATALLLAPDALWNPLTKEQKKQVAAWMNQINANNVHPNNWRFFRILVNVFFTINSLTPNKERLAEDLEVIENCYLGDGWYFDGRKCQKDYYIPFAMHFYGLIYAHFMKAYDPDRCARFKERAKQFKEDYKYWFAADGSEVPFGRSLTYRFAHVAFYAAYALANPDSDLREEKGMLLRNLRYWTKQPIVDKAGIFTIGYGYPNLIMSEDYNAPGSPYWSFKTFLMLALPADHAFWKAEEADMECVEKKHLAKADMILTHRGNHVQMYPVGQSFYEKGNSAAKYQKYVYSNQYGFSVSRGNTLEAGAFDNTLAASRGGENFYRMRSETPLFKVTEDMVLSEYSLGKGLRVASAVIPLSFGHVRMEYLDASEELDLAEGGYAISKEQRKYFVTGAGSGKFQQEMVKEEKNSITCRFPWGNSGICVLAQSEEVEVAPRLIQALPGTNLVTPLTMIPTICAKIPAGKHLLCTYVWADDTAIPEEIPVLEKQGEGWILRAAREKFVIPNAKQMFE